MKRDLLPRKPIKRSYMVFTEEHKGSISINADKGLFLLLQFKSLGSKINDNTLLELTKTKNGEKNHPIVKPV